MYNFKGFLQELSENSNIPFNLMTEDGIMMYQCGEKFKDSERLEVQVILGKQRAKLILNVKNENCTSLLKFYIENKYRELFNVREQIFIDILEGKGLASEKLDKNFPFLSQGCTLFLVSVDGSKYEALNIIKQIYNEQDIISMIYNEHILVIGHFEEVGEHAQSIRETIISNLYCRCYISYSEEAFESLDIKRAYEDAKECMLIGKKFEIKSEIYDYNDMVFEKTVHNISAKTKDEFLHKFKSIFNSFDSEMINTIEEFVNCGLNISEAAKKLYIHRNTLIYRLDKIAKDTGYDIRIFKQATIFIIAFLVWKESR